MAISPIQAAALAKIQAAKKAVVSEVKKVEATIIEEVKEVEQIAKTFYAKIAHSRFVHEDGTETVFHFGKAIVTNPAHIKELEAILPPNGNNPNIFLPDYIPPAPPKPAQNAVAEGELKVADAALLGKAVVSGELNEGVPGDQTGTMINESTIDANLVAAMNGISNAAQVIAVSGDKTLPGAAGSAS
jgi:hypothetical protein